MNEIEQKLIIERYQQCKETREKYVSRWKDIERFIAINSDVNSNFDTTKTPAQDKDVYVNDPTGFVSTNNAGDYLAGVLWQPDSISIECSDELKEITGEAFEDFFKKVTETTLNQINHSDAGFQSVLRAYCYEQYSYATSGIGTFRSKEYDNEQSACCLNFKNYTVQNSCIDEGVNNKINVIFTVYNWRLNQIIEEFCFVDGIFSKELYSQLPEKIKDDYENNNFNNKYKIVNGILPNNHFKMNKRGNAGARFKGYWFLENDKKIFKEEYFKVLPIAFCRAIRLANQIYGEGAGTIANSSVKMLNYVSGIAVDNIDKQTDPALGVVSGALVSGDVIDRTANAINTFNPQSVKDGASAIFPISQAGDIASVINFLIPTLKQDIANIYKLDQLLDFNNQTQMTASEASYRMSIRGKSINGLISQQKNELLEPVIHRVISIIQECNLYGNIINDMPVDTPEKLELKMKAFEENNFIPEQIVEFMKDGKQWYKIKYHGELERLMNNEQYQALGLFIQYLNFIIQINPQIVYAINVYELLTFLKSVSNLTNEKFVKSESEYKTLVANLEMAQIQQNEMNNAVQDAQINEMYSKTNKNNAEANNALTNNMYSLEV